MARRIFEFRCVKGHVTDKYVDDSVTTVVCPHCRNDASRIISAVRSSLDGTSGHFPDATDKWVKNRESHMRYERKKGIGSTEG